MVAGTGTGNAADAEISQRCAETENTLTAEDTERPENKQQGLFIPG
jgi:hypothetical protein